MISNIVQMPLAARPTIAPKPKGSYQTRKIRLLSEEEWFKEIEKRLKNRNAYFKCPVCEKTQSFNHVNVLATCSTCLHCNAIASECVSGTVLVLKGKDLLSFFSFEFAN